MKDFIEMLTHVILDVIRSPEWQKAVFQPMMKWFLWQIIPYICLAIGVQFFLMIAAISLVLYFRK